MRLSKKQRNILYPPIIKEFLADDIVTLTDLAKKHNVSYSSLCAYARQHNVNLKKTKRRHRYNDDIINTVIQNYIDDNSISVIKLSKKYGIAQPTIVRWLKEKGIEQRVAIPKWRIEKLEKAAKLYVSSSLNIVETAKEIGISKNQFAKYLKKHGLLKKNMVYQKNISFNKSYFHNIDIEEKAYWFGFIYADGCVRYDENTNSGQLTIEIQESDIDVLNKLNECLCSNLYIKKRQRIQDSGYVSNLCSLTFSSVEMYKDLIMYGCIPNKTYDGYIKKNLFSDNIELKIAFLRGYLDGDGYISKNKKSVSSLSYVIDNYKVMNYVLKAIISVSGIVPTVRYEYDELGHGAYRLRITNRKDFFAFLDVLYKNPTIYMKRKYDRYLEYKTSRPKTNSQESSDD